MNGTQKNRWFSLLLVLLVVANIVMMTMFWLQHKRHNKENMGRPGGDAAAYIIKELALDSNQQQVYSRLRQEHQERIRHAKDQARESKEALWDLLKKDTVTETELQQILAANAELDKTADRITFEHFRKVRAICNPAQKEKFDGIIKQVMRMMKPGPGGRRGPGAPGREDMPPPPMGDSLHDMPPPPDGEMPPPPRG
jgi:Spy/CpxP family protein refolding chaperone